jgi:cell division protease FtsH
MATAQPLATLPAGEASRLLGDQWRRLARAATFVAVLTSPAVFVWLTEVQGWSLLWSLVGTFFAVIAFRGMVDLVFRRAIPSPSLFGSDSQKLREEDVVNRRRVWFWRFWLRMGILVFGFITIAWLIRGGSYLGTFSWLIDRVGFLLSQPTLWIQIVFVFFLFIANFAILLGPLLAMNLTQIRGYEPGDAEWGVKLADVRGQAEAKEEVRRVVALWQSGEAFEKAGGKRERGLLFLGAPGTGKTMLAKAIATGFNSPFVSIPGSGFAATFIGIDAIVVRFLARKAKKLARKWGGQCIVFIDEIDAVGMRRQALNPGATGAMTSSSARTAPSIRPAT